MQGDGEAEAGGPPWTLRPEGTLLEDHQGRGRRATSPVTRLPGRGQTAGRGCHDREPLLPGALPGTEGGGGDPRMPLTPSCSCGSPGCSLINTAHKPSAFTSRGDRAEKQRVLTQQVNALAPEKTARCGCPFRGTVTTSVSHAALVHTASVSSLRPACTAPCPSCRG